MHLIVGRVLDTAADGQIDAAQPVSAPVAVAGPADPKISGLTNPIREAISSERDELIYEFVLEQVVAVLKLDPSQRPGAQHRLLDLGFDSLMAVQFRNRLGAGLSLARPLPATLLFDYPTIEAVSKYLMEVLFPGPKEAVVKAASAPILSEASVAAMPDSEIERLLLERLGSA